jgi:hypothetical protein
LPQTKYSIKAFLFILLFGIVGVFSAAAILGGGAQTHRYIGVFQLAQVGEANLFGSTPLNIKQVIDTFELNKVLDAQFGSATNPECYYRDENHGVGNVRVISTMVVNCNEDSAASSLFDRIEEFLNRTYSTKIEEIVSKERQELSAIKLQISEYQQMLESAEAKRSVLLKTLLREREVSLVKQASLIEKAISPETTSPFKLVSKTPTSSQRSGPILPLHILGGFFAGSSLGLLLLVMTRRKFIFKP